MTAPAPGGGVPTPLDMQRLAILADRASRAHTLVPRRDGVESLSDYWRGEIAWLVDEVQRLAAAASQSAALRTELEQVSDFLLVANERIFDLKTENDALREQVKAEEATVADTYRLMTIEDGSTATEAMRCALELFLANRRAALQSSQRAPKNTRS